MLLLEPSQDSEGSMNFGCLSFINTWHRKCYIKNDTLFVSWIGTFPDLHVSEETHSLQNIWGLDKELTTPQHKKPACYEMLHSVSRLVGSCEHSNELSGSINGREFLD